VKTIVRRMNSSSSSSSSSSSRVMNSLIRMNNRRLM